MTISKLRGHLYVIAKIAGDVQAATHAKPGTAIPKRIGRRIAGYLAGRIACGQGCRLMEAGYAQRFI